MTPSPHPCNIKANVLNNSVALWLGHQPPMSRKNSHAQLEAFHGKLAQLKSNRRISFYLEPMPHFALFASAICGHFFPFFYLFFLFKHIERNRKIPPSHHKPLTDAQKYYI